MLFWFLAVWYFIIPIITCSTTAVTIIIIIILITYCALYLRGCTTWLNFSVLRSTLAPNSLLLCWLWTFENLLGISEVLFYSISVSQTVHFSLLDALQLLILFVVTDILGTKIVFLNRILKRFILLNKLIIAFNMNACLYIFSHQTKSWQNYAYSIFNLVWMTQIALFGFLSLFVYVSVRFHFVRACLLIDRLVVR
jgi:hypothetical protein